MLVQPTPDTGRTSRPGDGGSASRVGASSESLVDVRILSATHKDLSDLVSDGRFRHDLYYRINVIELRVPPLRERGGEATDIHADRRQFDDNGRGGIRLQAALCALELLLPPPPPAGLEP